MKDRRLEQALTGLKESVEALGEQNPEKKYPWSKTGELDAREMTDIIYDTLMGNTQYTQFDPEKAEEQEVDAGKGQMQFIYDGTGFRVTVKEAKIERAEESRETLGEIKDISRDPGMKDWMWESLRKAVDYVAGKMEVDPDDLFEFLQTDRQGDKVWKEWKKLVQDFADRQEAVRAGRFSW